MAHEKFRNTLTFTDQFGKLLRLSPEQVKAIDDLDYEHMRSYMFNVPAYPYENEREAQLAYWKKQLNVLRPVQLLDKQTHEVFFDKLTFIYLETPRFKKSEEELVTHFDKWLYVLKHLKKLQDIPKKLQE